MGCEVDVEDHHCEVEDHHVSSSWVLSSLVFHVGGRGGSGTALCFGAWRFGSAGASPSAILGPVGLCVLFIFSILPSHLEKTSDQQAGHKVKPRFDSTRFFEPASWPIKTSKLAKEPSDLKTDQQAGQSAPASFYPFQRLLPKLKSVALGTSGLCQSVRQCRIQPRRGVVSLVTIQPVQAAITKQLHPAVFPELSLPMELAQRFQPWREDLQEILLAMRNLWKRHPSSSRFRRGSCSG